MHASVEHAQLHARSEGGEELRIVRTRALLQDLPEQSHRLQYSSALAELEDKRERARSLEQWKIGDILRRERALKQLRSRFH